MTHQTNDNSIDLNAKIFFAKARRIYIEDPLKTFGFKKFRSSAIARLTAGDVFQFLYFQKSAYGGQNFTVNVAIRPLFSQNTFLSFTPGNRLGSMSTNNQSEWWNYTTESDCDKSFKDIFNKIERAALPFFDATTNSNDIIASYEKVFSVNKYGYNIGWGTIGWEDFDFGHIYLHAKQIEKAVKHFDACYETFSKDNRDWAQSASEKCLEIKKIIESGHSEIDRYLVDTINESRQKLKLVGW